jgi:hypothetical protein
MNQSLGKQNTKLVEKNNHLIEILEDLMAINNQLINKEIRKTSVNKLSTTDGKIAKLLNPRHISILRSLKRSTVIEIEPNENELENIPSIEKLLDSYSRQIISMKEYVIDTYKENKQVKDTFDTIVNDYKKILGEDISK